MATKLGLKELKQGNIIKVELGNGEILKGCFYGKILYKERGFGNTIESITGNYVVVIDPVDRKPTVISLENYTGSKKTTVKGVYATRFPNAVSRYLKKYVLTLDKQQKLLLEELKLQGKRAKEDERLKSLGNELESIDYEVDESTLPLEQRVGIIFKNFEMMVKNKCKGFFSYTPHYREFYGERELTISVSSRAMDKIPSNELGVTYIREYDNEYTVEVDDRVDLNKTAMKYLHISEADIKGFTTTINQLKGVKLRTNKIFTAIPDSRPGRGELDIEIRILLDKNVPSKTLERIREEIVQFLVTAGRR